MQQPKTKFGEVQSCWKLAVEEEKQNHQVVSSNQLESQPEDSLCLYEKPKAKKQPQQTNNMICSLVKRKLFPKPCT